MAKAPDRPVSELGYTGSAALCCLQSQTRRASSTWLQRPCPGFWPNIQQPAQSRSLNDYWAHNWIKQSCLGWAAVPQFYNLLITEGIEKKRNEMRHRVVTTRLTPKPRAVRSRSLPRSTTGQGALKWLSWPLLVPGVGSFPVIRDLWLRPCSQMFSHDLKCF